MSINLGKYDTNKLWSLIGDLSDLTNESGANKDFWLEVGAAITKEIDKRLESESNN